MNPLSSCPCLMSVRGQDVIFFHHYMRVLNGLVIEAVDAHDGAGRRFGGDLIIGTQTEEWTAGDNRAICRLERLAKRINKEARRFIQGEQPQDLLGNSFADG